MLNRERKRWIGRQAMPFAVGLIVALLVCFLTSCDGLVVDPGGGDVVFEPGQPGPGPTGPGSAPDPESPSDPDPGPTNAPTTLLHVTTHGDSLFVSSGAHVGVGQRVRIPIRMVVTSERTFGVVVGQEAGSCNGRIDIVGILDDGTAGKSGYSRGSLTPADAFTAWFEDACELMAWHVPFGPGGGVYSAEIIVEGIEPGKAEFRSQFEIMGFEGENFRWVVHSRVNVVP